MSFQSFSLILISISLFYGIQSSSVLHAESISPKPDSLSTTKGENHLILTPEGKIASLSFSRQGKQVPIAFRKDEHSGPSWIVKGETEEEKKLPCPKNPAEDRIPNDVSPHVVRLEAIPGKKNCFTGERNGIDYSLEYELQNDGLKIKASITNHTKDVFHPVGSGLQLGLDTCMTDYPQWNNIYFPTLLRCEKTHFWGYFMTPSGDILGVSSPDPIASWSNSYNGTGLHRIYTSSLYLLNQAPLPERHPKHLSDLPPGETRQWTILLTPILSLSEVKSTLSATTQAPMIEAKGRYTLAEKETAAIQIHSITPITATLNTPDGQKKMLTVIRKHENEYRLDLSLDDTPGVYQLTVKNTEGKSSEAQFYKRHPWSWYLKQARKATIEAPPLAAPYAEWWYNSHTAFLAKQYVPLPKEDALTEKYFREEILPKVFNIETGEARMRPDRIQKIGTIIQVLVEAYKTDGDIRDLETAARIADWHVNHNQGEDGAYRYNKTGHHYTSVIYPAKSMLVLAKVEKELGKTSPEWNERFQRHFASANTAIEELAKNLDNIGTEGEHTFEDGMISCSALQIAYRALFPDAPNREHFAKAARHLLQKHRCLQQLEIPDCRMNGGTLRFWEAIYDLRLSPNMMNSPHGWSSWKTYATYYMYLIDGDEHWLKETMDAVGSAMQVIDSDTGKLRWGFVPDPFIRGYARTQSPDTPGKEIYTNKIIGEQYLDMNRTWYDKQASDNCVHEHFAMMCEVALPHAFVLQRKDGSLLTYNCTTTQEKDTLVIRPHEELVKAVHVNLQKPENIRVHFGKSVKETQTKVGMHWIRK